MDRAGDKALERKARTTVASAMGRTGAHLAQAFPARDRKRRAMAILESIPPVCIGDPMTTSRPRLQIAASNSRHSAGS